MLRHYIFSRKFVPVLLVLGCCFFLGGYIRHQGLYINLVNSNLVNNLRSIILPFTSNWFAIKVKEMQITGRYYTTLEDICSVADICSNDDFGITLGMGMHKIRSNLEMLPSVQSAIVKMDSPHTLVVQLVEETPVAIWWENKQHVWVINSKGEKIVPFSNEDEKQISDIFLIVGPYANEHIAEARVLHDLLDDVLRGMQIIALVRVNDRRWDIEIDSGARILLPESLIESMQEIKEFLTHSQIQKYLRNGDRIDIRDTKRVFIRYSEGH